jgi:hypothetical protein
MNDIGFYYPIIWVFVAFVGFFAFSGFAIEAIEGRYKIAAAVLFFFGLFWWSPLIWKVSIFVIVGLAKVWMWVW